MDIPEMFPKLSDYSVKTISETKSSAYQRGDVLIKKGIIEGAVARI